MSDQNNAPSEGKCPVMHGPAAGSPTTGSENHKWWPERLNLQLLAQNPPARRPFEEDFDYAAAFESIDYEALKKDISEALVTSHDFYPADFGNYGPGAVRMAWHSAGTYRAQDGRGGANTGQQRFAPINSWPDNILTDRIRRILWPVKKKYGKKISWADLIVLAGNVALEDMGFPTLGFAGGREDTYEPEQVNWGPESEWLGNARYSGTEDSTRDLDNPLAAVQMGLIYVNPEGPDGNPDPKASAHDIRETFARMSMDDEETVALIAGGHTFGKTHGNNSPDVIGPEPEAAPLEHQGIGWRGPVGNDTMGGGPEVTWTYHPTRWDNEFFHILYGYEWELMESKAGAKQWRPIDGGGSDMVPMAHGDGRIEPRMLTSDLALRYDPEYDKISRRFKDDQTAFTDAFARAWFKLIHRDLGPKARYVGPEIPEAEFDWQDPVNPPAHVPSEDEVGQLKEAIARAVDESTLTIGELVTTAWAAASSFRITDFRGGANGARLRLAPQKDWEVNKPEELATVLDKLEAIQNNAGVDVSFADLLVLAGGVGVELAAKAAGHSITVPFTPGRGDATQEQTDEQSFKYMEPIADGFRNYNSGKSALPAEHLLIDRAALLNLTVPEMTVLVGGLRVLGTNHDGSADGVFTSNPGQLSNDFFVNLLDIDTTWTRVDDGAPEANARYEGTTADGTTYTGTRVDLVFGANSELRAIAEVYGADDAADKFLEDFVAAWVKVMEADRFDLHR
ncbi:catalase/peroxidase HPI [Corynebacterium sp. 320]|uniref:catalase/peroxidase HPI n=1 Tax=Corynebacterium TaxID=1716 RepID=UPI00125CB873|nr:MULTISPECIES: catalase/peroxidase HPI [Corynebacterium]KAB1502789.1 catalase/peroxidase HPI [Corynebacterium sp. 320]KAB1550470.1 catalase/peroxidase HPI [Corynebacterium sp. 319]KAB1554799.1 catalase/peroxidase HPI [Corynebacterium sp. 321]KAB3526452.1 catalase/peroxidase HPI [Corynebacterium sp. 250]KAB3539771.1 catalase/peroxidase HPI [Corynebacterium sp. 366]